MRYSEAAAGRAGSGGAGPPPAAVAAGHSWPRSVSVDAAAAPSTATRLPADQLIAALPCLASTLCELVPVALGKALEWVLYSEGVGRDYYRTISERGEGFRFPVAVGLFVPPVIWPCRAPVRRAAMSAVMKPATSDQSRAVLRPV